MLDYTSAPWQVNAANHAAAFVEGPGGALIGATDTRPIGMTKAAVCGNNALVTAAPLLFTLYEQLLGGSAVDRALADVMEQAEGEGARHHAEGPWGIVQRAAYVVVCASNGMPLMASTLTSRRRVREFAGSVVLVSAAPDLYRLGRAYLSHPATDRAETITEIRGLMLRLAAQAAELATAIASN